VAGVGAQGIRQGLGESALQHAGIEVWLTRGTSFLPRLEGWCQALVDIPDRLVRCRLLDNGAAQLEVVVGDGLQAEQTSKGGENDKKERRLVGIFGVLHINKNWSVFETHLVVLALTHKFVDYRVHTRHRYFQNCGSGSNMQRIV